MDRDYLNETSPWLSEGVSTISHNLVKSNEKIDVVVRPEDIEITSVENGMLVGKVNSVTFKGVHYEIEVEQENTKWIIHNIKSAKVGSTVGLIIDPEAIHIMRKVSNYEKEK